MTTDVKTTVTSVPREIRYDGVIMAFVASLSNGKVRAGLCLNLTDGDSEDFHTLLRECADMNERTLIKRIADLL